MVHSTETMSNKGKGPLDDKEEYIKIRKHLFDDIKMNMNQHLMKGFELMAGQFGSRVIGGISSSQS